MSITKRIDEAREAFEKKDLTASEAAHSPEAIAQASEEHGGASHQYIGDMVYGGLDGIVTTFAVVSGVAGAGLGLGVILILGLVLGQGCITITTPDMSGPTTSVNVTPPPPINPSWIPPSSTSQPIDVEDLPAIAEAVAIVKPSVVAITTETLSRFFNQSFTQEGAGSGWIIDSDGIIVTNNHVIEGASSITVTLDDGSSYTADVDSIATDFLNRT